MLWLRFFLIRFWTRDCLKYKCDLTNYTTPKHPWNKQDVSGVEEDKRDGRWNARIHTNNKRIYIGNYKTKEEAIKARLDKEIELVKSGEASKRLMDKHRYLCEYVKDKL